MELTLKNFKTALPKAILKDAVKFAVRECEEIEKGRFIAFVDEGKDSYDVSLSFAKTGDVLEHSCDCTHQKGYCKHKAALLHHLSQAKKEEKAPSKAKKKESATATLLRQVDEDELRRWVADLLQKNKDLVLSFSLHFSAQQHYTPQQVESLTATAVKAAIGSKRNIDSTQLKRLVDLLAEVHAPILKYYKSNLAEKSSFLLLHAIVEGCYRLGFKVKSTSNRIAKYVENTLDQTVESIHLLQTEEAWAKAVGYYIDHLVREEREIRIEYLSHLINIYKLCGEGRRLGLLEMLVSRYTDISRRYLYHKEKYQNVVLSVTLGLRQFTKYHELFSPIRHDVLFNEHLIRNLIGIGELERAEKYCREQIAANVKDEFNVPYLTLLKEIYTRKGDANKLMAVVSEMLPFTFSIDDYKYVAAALPETEQQKLRLRLLNRAKRISHSSNPAAAEFSFALALHEKKFSKMIREIGSDTTFGIILKYFDPMFQHDKMGLLNAIMDKSDRSWYHSPEHEADEQVFPELYERIVKSYEKDLLLKSVRAKLNPNGYAFGNRFLRYMKQRLIP